MIPNFIIAQLEHQNLVSDQILSALDDLYRGGRDRVNRRRVDTRLSALHEDWQEFAGNHKSLSSEISELPPEAREVVKSESYFTQNVFRTTREAFLESFEKMTTLLDEMQDGLTAGGPSQNPQTSSSNPVSCRLSRIEPPKFNGDYTEWLTFRDMFTSIIIQNKSLSPVEKLYYLRSSLTDSAALLLKHTPLTGANFQTAWNDLTAYYDNKRVLIGSVLNSLFSINCMQKESAKELEDLCTTIQQSIRSLEMLEQPVQHWVSFLVYLTTRCLDPNTVRAWELELGSSTDYPKWSQLGNCLISRIRSLQAVTRASSSKSTQPRQLASKSQNTLHSNRQSKSNTVQQVNSLNSVIKACVVCENDHLIYKCPEYASKPMEGKLDIIKQKSLCFNCLGSHLAKSCPSTRRCTKCGKKHHTSIHKPTSKSNDNSSKKPPVDETPQSESELTNKQANHLKSSSSPLRTSVLLATARAKLELDDGRLIDVRILIDQGSEISLVTEQLVQKYRIPRRKSYLSIVGAGTQAAGKSRGSVSLKLKSNYNPDYHCLMTAEILPQLTSDIPSTKVSQQSWAHLNEIEFADPNFADPSSVDIILGADLYHQIIQAGLSKGQTDSPIAQLTSFGWILSGPSGQTSSIQPAQGYHCSCERDWYGLIEDFWRQEELIEVKPSLSPAEEECEKTFVSTYTRVESGKYQVRLPLNGPVTSLGDSKQSALRGLYRLFHKFASNKKFYLQYDNFFKEYEDLGHMKRVSSHLPEPTPVNYIPHHGVLSHNDKLRVVFNGSSKVFNGTPLNDLLHIGAKLQTDLVDVLLYFRKFKYVFSTDIEKMYRQILVHPDDWCLQRIL